MARQRRRRGAIRIIGVVYPDDLDQRTQDDVSVCIGELVTGTGAELLLVSVAPRDLWGKYAFDVSDEWNQGVIQEYADRMREGVRFPPVVIDSSLWDDLDVTPLCEGVHRTVAAAEAGKRRIEAIDVAGWRDWRDRLPGGRADPLTPADVDPKQLARGTAHEMEHTDDPRLATEIALDHLAETPDYYDRLEAMERQPNAGKSYLQRAIAHYGLTDDWTKAGFILPDGSLLDFSEGGTERSQDHRNLSFLVGGKAGREAETGARWPAVQRFMEVTGAIRFMPEAPGFDIYARPTHEQLNRMILILIESGTLPILEMERPGRPRFNKVYEAVASWDEPGEILRDFERDVRRYWGV